MSEFKIKRRFPNYCTGFEETEHIISSKEELENIDWVKHMIDHLSFHALAISIQDDSLSYLMVVNNYDKIYGGCKSWWVVGYIKGDNVEELNLPYYGDLIGDHLDGCPQKTWQHNKCTCGFR